MAKSKCSAEMKIIQIQNNTQVEFVYNRTFIPLELGNVC